MGFLFDLFGLFCAQDDLGLDPFSISGFFLTCVGTRAVWAAGTCVGFLFDLFWRRAVWAAGLLKAVTGAVWVPV